jgi:hypothetical protein
MSKPEGISARRIGAFALAHLKWVLLGPVIMVAGTTVHELVHCGAALLTGGTITELHIFPTVLDRFVFGYMDAVDNDLFWTNVSPALLSSCVATLAYAWMKPGQKLAFVLLYLLPLFDAAMAVWAPVVHVETADLSMLPDHLGLLSAAALAFFALHVWNAPKLFRDTLSDAEVRLLVALFLTLPALRFVISSG